MTVTKGTKRRSQADRLQFENSIAMCLDSQIRQGRVESYFRPGQREGRDTWLVRPTRSWFTDEMTTAEVHAFVIGMRLVEVDTQIRAAEAAKAAEAKDPDAR